MFVEPKHYDLQVNKTDTDQLGSYFSKVKRKKIKGSIPPENINYFEGEEASLLSQLHKKKALQQYLQVKDYLSKSNKGLLKVSQTPFGAIDIFNELEKTGFTEHSKDCILIMTIEKDLAGILAYITGTPKLVLRKGISENVMELGLAYADVSSIILNGYDYPIPLSVFLGIDYRLDNFLIYLRNLVEGDFQKVQLHGLEYDITGKDITNLFYLYVLKTSFYLLERGVAKLMPSRPWKDLVTCHSYTFSNIIFRPLQVESIPEIRDNVDIIFDNEYSIVLEISRVSVGNYKLIGEVGK